MAEDRPRVGTLVGRIMPNGHLVIHPSKPSLPMFTEEDAAPYIKRGWTPIRDPEDLEDLEDWLRQQDLERRLRRDGTTGE